MIGRRPFCAAGWQKLPPKFCQYFLPYSALALSTESVLQESAVPNAALQKYTNDVAQQSQPIFLGDFLRRSSSQNLAVTCLSESLIRSKCMGVARLQQPCKFRWHEHQPYAASNCCGCHAPVHVLSRTVEQQNRLEL
jgi:hypothetical protein